MNAVETINLTKKFKDRTAVDELNLTIKKGELFALLGQNGAGKTVT
ncbi:MAG: ATP-binding cassette domain-containing protein, partial [Eubacteriales bacterium]